MCPGPGHIIINGQRPDGVRQIQTSFEIFSYLMDITDIQ